MKRRQLEVTITMLLFLAAGALAGIVAIGILGACGYLAPKFDHVRAWLTVLVASCAALIPGLSAGRYRFVKGNIGSYIRRSLLQTLYFGGIWAVLLLLEKDDITASRYFFVTTLLLHAVFLTTLLYVVEQNLIRNFYKSSTATLAAVLGTEEDVLRITEVLKRDWSRRILGIRLTDRKDREKIGKIPVVGSTENFVDWVRSHAIDEIYIVDPEITSPFMVDAIENFIQMGVAVYINMPGIEKLSSRLKEETARYVPKTSEGFGMLQGTPMFIMEQPELRLSQAIWKRTLDIIGGLVGSIIAAILYVIVGIAIKIDSPGPVIFAQERIGKNGRHFKMYKFRSMYQDAEARKAALMKENEMNGLMFKMKDDPRITRVGKFIRKTSIDEFPQFFNVLRGDMSLVGTRPPTVGEFEQYENYHKRRLSMKPGITGLWQVSGRSDITDFEEVVRLDCEYIDNWSFKKDLQILVKTVGAVFTHKGSE